jgi:NO-binding membrane sensor protein with MHYT domain
VAVAYQWELVLLSIVMAIQGAYVGLSLAMQVRDAEPARQRLLLASSAFSLAVAIWTMHFVGMLATRMPFPADYLVFPTLLSFLVCVMVVGIAVYATSFGPSTPMRLALASVLMGAGIVSMHYIGMSALHASAHMVHDPIHVAASLVIAVAAAGLALWLATGGGGKFPLALSAIVFGIAVSGMHYTAMRGTAVFPHAAAPGSPALSADLLAIVVAVVAFVLSGLFLLFLVPDRAREARAPQPAAVPEDAAAPDHDPASHVPGALARQLPVERDGVRQFVRVEDVVAVHANAHYTYIFNGTTKLFCPLAIGEVETRLDKTRFARIHRSHIINIERVVGYRRSGDSELVELAAAERYSVPVSRSRIGWLKSRMLAAEHASAADDGGRHFAAQ